MSSHPSLSRRWAWLGLAAGLGLGLVDTVLLLATGVRMDLGGQDATVAVGLVFATSFGALGFLIGLLAAARTRLRRDARTIAAQLDELRRTQARVLHYEKLATIGRLAAGVAHEVRNPLGVIRASASHIAESLDDGEGARACAFIRAEVDRLDAFIRALLDYARPLEPQAGPVDLAAVVARAEQVVAERRGDAVTVSASIAPDCALRADADLLAQVVLGLATNAAEAIAERGRIEVRAHRDGDAVRIEVADDGPGVAAEHRAQLFEPFFTTKTGGTGLGLAMAARIAEAHGGRLELADGAGAGPDGRGACFRLTLPQRPAKSSEAA